MTVRTLVTVTLLLILTLAMSLAGCAVQPKPAPPVVTPAPTPPSPTPAVRKPAPQGTPYSYTVGGRRYDVMASAQGYRDEGLATFYGRGHHGRRTSSGEKFDMHGLTAAHRTVPFNTMLRVTNLENSRSVVVRVNDRGPFVATYLIDISQGAAQALGMTITTRVRVEAVD